MWSGLDWVLCRRWLELIQHTRAIANPDAVIEAAAGECARMKGIVRIGWRVLQDSSWTWKLKEHLRSKITCPHLIPESPGLRHMLVNDIILGAVLAATCHQTPITLQMCSHLSAVTSTCTRKDQKSGLGIAFRINGPYGASMCIAWYNREQCQR